jgi:hypothetical protein
MLAHGRDELIALAEQCVISCLPEVNGWKVDAWDMDDSHVELAIQVYAAVLAGGTTDPVIALLADSGIDLTEALNDAEHSKDDITRSDLTELTAAASMIAEPGCNVDYIYMPNVPKMSRRKSDSGVDIFVAVLRKAAGVDDLYNDEFLTVASVKHSIDHSTGGMRWKLADSLSARELSIPYMATQLRVLNARLQQEGFAREEASRVYIFLRDFPQPSNVDLFAIGVVEPDLRDDLAHHITLLPTSPHPGRTFRMIFLPGLTDVHLRCP